MKNPDVFFAHCRRAPFDGRMTAAQVAGLNALLDAGEGLPVHQLAYVLATVFHETARSPGTSITDAVTFN